MPAAGTGRIIVVASSSLAVCPIGIIILARTVSVMVDMARFHGSELVVEIFLQGTIAVAL